MLVPNQRKIHQIFQHLVGGLLRNLTGKRQAPQHLRNLYVEEMERVQGCVRLQHSLRVTSSERRLQ